MEGRAQAKDYGILFIPSYSPNGPFQGQRAPDRNPKPRALRPGPWALAPGPGPGPRVPGPGSRAPGPRARGPAGLVAVRIFCPGRLEDFMARPNLSWGLLERLCGNSASLKNSGSGLP